MVSYPNYDPNVYILQTPENDKIKRELELDTTGSPLLNRGIQSVYPPGSTFKVVTNMAILNEGLVSFDKTFFCNGFYKIGTDTFECWVYLHGHGWQNQNSALINSCDVYFYKKARKYKEKIKKKEKKFGYGSHLGIDLPSEVNGLIPDPEWKLKLGLTWVGGDNLNTVIGQGDVKVTALQILNSYNIISNKGYSYKPHLLKNVLSSIDGSVIEEYRPDKIIDLISNSIDENIFNSITRSLRGVVSEGTAVRAFSGNQFRFAGKTGTAEVGMGKKKQTHSLFAGFGPIDFPNKDRISIIVLCEYENGNFLRFAAPIASMVVSSYYRKEDYLTTAERLGYPIKDTYRTE
jgi:penicillin-binding protein 2